MKCIGRLLSVYLVCCVTIWGYAGQRKELLPEIDLLEKIQRLRGNEVERDSLIRSADFLDNPLVVHHLLLHLRSVDSIDEIGAIGEVLTRMTCHPETIMFEQLRYEKEPVQKAKLLPLVLKFQGAQALLEVIHQLDDTRIAEYRTYPEPPPYPARVCDIAYNFLIWKLIELDAIGPRQFPYPVYGPDETQDRRIADVIVYWEQHKDAILEQIEEKAIPTSSPDQ